MNCVWCSTTLGVAYPAYASYKTIRSKDPHPEVNQQMSQWLTYWAVWSTLTAAESLLPRRSEIMFTPTCPGTLWSGRDTQGPYCAVAFRAITISSSSSYSGFKAVSIRYASARQLEYTTQSRHCCSVPHNFSGASSATGCKAAVCGACSALPSQARAADRLPGGWGTRPCGESLTAEPGSQPSTTVHESSHLALCLTGMLSDWLLGCWCMYTDGLLLQ